MIRVKAEFKEHEAVRRECYESAMYVLSNDLDISDDSDMESLSIEKLQKPYLSTGLPVPSDFDVMNIFKDVTKLAAVEKHLNILYRPFICFARMNCVYNLSELDLLIPQTKYEPHRHPALFISRTQPVCSMKVYANGNIYCQGFNRHCAEMGLAIFINLLKDYNYNSDLHNPKFNVVNATFSVPFNVNLKRMHQESQPYTLYNPKKLPYVIYRMSQKQIKLAIFPMGYVYVLYATKARYTKVAISFILPILYKYKMVEQQTGEQAVINRGDINFKLLWEKEFQKEDDFTIEF